LQHYSGQDVHACEQTSKDDALHKIASDDFLDVLLPRRGTLINDFLSLVLLVPGSPIEAAADNAFDNPVVSSGGGTDAYTEVEFPVG
jgi:hypothetical protein